MLWTIMPDEVIFGGVGEDPAVARYRSLGEAKYLGTRGEAGEERIARLLSTDPVDYLDPRFLPGSPWRWPG